MSLSIQTNVDSINAQQNLRVNQSFQSQTIERLTSGYRINSSSDDAAGLAVANKFRDDIAELNQGVRNANDGISALQIVDGGLSNISTMIDRLKTLATQSASATFSGDRQTLNTEYQTLLGEINRQANNIGLGTGAIGGRYGQNIDVYIGGGAGIQGNAMVTANMSGAQVDAKGLGVLSTNILGGAGVSIDTTNMNTAGPFLAGGASQVFTFRTASNEAGKTVTINGTTAGLSSDDVVTQFNQQLQGTGIAAVVASDGTLQFFGDKTAFSVDAAAASGGTGVVAAATNDVVNPNMYSIAGTTLAGAGGTVGAATSATFTVNGTNVTLAFKSTDKAADVASTVNAALSQFGITAVVDHAGTAVGLQGTSAFSVSGDASVIFTDGSSANPTAANTSSTQNADSAISALEAAVTTLGQVQGKVGTAQNQLQYAVNLAQSQIASFSAAQSRIRDADIASEASNLTKAQVLQQSSLAALAQANSAPQALAKLLQ